MPETLTIRAARRADIAAIDALLARSYPRLLKADYPPSALVLAVPLISRARPRLVTSGRYYVAEREGRIVGAGGWSPRRGARAEIRHVVTDHRELRKGIGRAIMSRIFDAAGGQGARAFDCLATRTAVPFYQAVGFTALGAVEIGLGPGIVFPVIQMRRESR